MSWLRIQIILKFQRYLAEFTNKINCDIKVSVLCHNYWSAAFFAGAFCRKPNGYLIVVFFLLPHGQSWPHATTFSLQITSLIKKLNWTWRAYPFLNIKWSLVGVKINRKTISWKRQQQTEKILKYSNITKTLNKYRHFQYVRQLVRNSSKQWQIQGRS